MPNFEVNRAQGKMCASKLVNASTRVKSGTPGRPREKYIRRYL